MGYTGLFLVMQRCRIWFLSILKQRREAIREILNQLSKETRRFMLKYVINETQDEKLTDAVNQLIQILTTDLPEEKETIMAEANTRCLIFMWYYFKIILALLLFLHRMLQHRFHLEQYPQ